MRVIISIFILLVMTGCGSSSPTRPTLDRCLGLHTRGLPECSPPDYVPEMKPTRTAIPIALLHDEISYRLQEMHSLLEQEPMTKGVFLKVTSAFAVSGASISHEFKNWGLRTLLIESERVAPEEDRPSIQNIRNWFEELERFGPQHPFPESEPADAQTVQAARDLFKLIEAEWQLFLEQSK